MAHRLGAANQTTRPREMLRSVFLPRAIGRRKKQQTAGKQQGAGDKPGVGIQAVDVLFQGQNHKQRQRCLQSPTAPCAGPREVLFSRDGVDQGTAAPEELPDHIHNVMPIIDENGYQCAQMEQNIQKQVGLLHRLEAKKFCSSERCPELEMGRNSAIPWTRPRNAV